MGGVISLPDTTSYDKQIKVALFTVTYFRQKTLAQHV